MNALFQRVKKVATTTQDPRGVLTAYTRLKEIYNLAKTDRELYDDVDLEEVELALLDTLDELALLQSDNALQYQSEAYSIFPNNVRVLCNLGQYVHTTLGDHDSALKCYFTALYHDRASTRALQGIARIAKSTNMHYLSDSLFHLASQSPKSTPETVENSNTIPNTIPNAISNSIQPLTLSKRVFPKPFINVGYLVANVFDENGNIYLLEKTLFDDHASLYKIFVYSSEIQFWDKTQTINKVTQWRCIQDIPSLSVANVIAQDEIDVLVHISGESNCIREILLYRPAPVQFSLSPIMLREPEVRAIVAKRQLDPKRPESKHAFMLEWEQLLFDGYIDSQ